MKLSNLPSVEHLKSLSYSELDELAADIRRVLIQTVSGTGGHLGPNLGVVELSIAIHRIFESPKDHIVFDTGHQSYVHKLLTGRVREFSTLRQAHGLSGYPSRNESEHDIVENSHASTALSWIDGIADGLQLQGKESHVVGVIGDGALTGGMAWEAMNNIAGKQNRPVVVIVNDNGRSYSPTIGGIAQQLTSLRTNATYEAVLGWGKKTLLQIPFIGRPLFNVIHGIKRGVADAAFSGGLFQDLGMKYIGPIDGHNLKSLETALKYAKNFPGPVLVHCITQKGRGYVHAENDVADHFHGIGVIDPETGKAIKVAHNTWTNAFGEELVELGHSRPEIVAMTAAMLTPTGLQQFADRFPERIFDVGIAEQHAATSAAGMAFAGLHPVVAIYATFINRAFDQVLMDCALHKAGVTFVLDRAGVTGDDGASHNGIWDLSLLKIIPGIRIFAPRDRATLKAALTISTNHSSGPSVIRFPKGEIHPDFKVMGKNGNIDVLSPEMDGEVLVIAVGPLAEVGLEVGESLKERGISACVLSPLEVFPIDSSLIEKARASKFIITIEDGLSQSGIGDALSASLRDNNVFVPVKNFGVKDGFLEHANRKVILQSQGIVAHRISCDVVAMVSEAR